MTTERAEPGGASGGSGGGAGPPPFRYTAALAGRIETAWQERWEAERTFVTPNPGEAGFDASRPKFYCLDMFPYPSGEGLHVGHPEGYTATDIISRYKRMKGFHVLHPMGWDAFGLPAEQYAVRTGVHPAITTKKAIETFRRQLKRFGFSYDWSREIATIDPDYYRWTQWIFLRLYDAWYDRGADRTRPIAELLGALERNEYGITPTGDLVAVSESARELGAITGPPVGVRMWHELSQDERRAFIDDQRLAYLSEQTVNWCPKLGTALANEEVKDGKSERGGYPVFRKTLKQWMFRITAYAERLAHDLNGVDWPTSTRTMQTEWIGRSEGAEIRFALVDRDDAIEVYTTRPDTIFGATFMALAPEHPLVDEVLAAPPPGADIAAIRAYVAAARARSEVDRQTEGKDKTGVFSGLYATNPASGAQIPVWIADYVLMGYGHGAIMAVPGHDQRDFDFARKFGIPVREVVKPPEVWSREHANKPDTVFEGEGVAINSLGESVSLDGLPTPEAKAHVTDWAEKAGIGRRKVNFKLRDWLFSRQRYWGEPFPIVYDDAGNHYPVSESALPVRLPEMEKFAPPESDDPAPMLAAAPRSWLHTTAGEAGVDPHLLPPQTPVRREANTMPNWAGSCWYYLRYCDPKNSAALIGPESERYWTASKGTGAVDLYVGGAEHAVLHLLYARFWHKALFDLRHVSTPEPAQKLFHQGLILSFSYERPDKTLVPTDQVEEVSEGKFIEKATGQPLKQVIAKMSKSLKNVVNPDDVIAEYGADTVRLYEMYMGPLEASKPWNPRDISGLFRFLQRAWRLLIDEESGRPRTSDAADPPVEKALHRTIAKVEGDIERLAFNTAIAAMIEFVNQATASGKPLTHPQAERFALVLAPFVPHVAEEAWYRLGRTKSLAYEPWPAVDPAMLTDSEVEIPVQVNGKLRDRITVPAEAEVKAVEAAALAASKVREVLDGKTVVKIVVVSRKLVNIVIR